MDKKDSPQEALARRLRRCGHVLYHQKHHSQQGAVLALLETQGATNQKQIQEQLSIKPGSVSELISKLEDKQLVVRSRDENDRRRVVLCLTEKGRTAARIHIERPEENLFDALSQEEMDRMTQLLDKLLASWGL